MFVDRDMLNTSTGALTIKELTSDDSGSYMPEINDKVQAAKEFRVICKWRKSWMRTGEQTGMVWLSLLVFPFVQQLVSPNRPSPHSVTLRIKTVSSPVKATPQTPNQSPSRGVPVTTYLGHPECSIYGRYNVSPQVIYRSHCNSNNSYNHWNVWY